MFLFRRFPRCAAAAALFLAFCTAPATAQARPTEVTPLPAMRVVSEAEQSARLLATRGTGLRMAGAGSVDGLLAALKSGEATAAAPLEARASGRDGQVLSDFLRQSTQYVSVSGNDGVIGWWNPFDDLWIVSIWNRDAAGWTLVRTGAFLGSDFDTDAAPDFDWGQSNKSFVTTLQMHNWTRVIAYQSAVRDHRLPRLMNDASLQSRAWAALPERHLLMAGQLKTVEMTPGLTGYDSLIKAAADSAVTEDECAEICARLRSLPGYSRQTLHAVMVVRHGNGLIVAMQSPLTPAFILLADIRGDVVSGSPRILALRAVSLFAKASS